MWRMGRWSVIAALVLAFCLLMLPTRAYGSPPFQAPEPTPTPEPEEDSPGLPERILGGITQIFHVMTFPVESMTKALNGAVTNLAAGAFEHAAAPFADVIGQVTGGELAFGPSADLYRPTWSLMRNIAMALWPLTLGLIVAGAARRGVIDNAVTFANLKEGLIGWVTACVLTVASAWIIDMGIRLTRGMTTAIMTAQLRGPLNIGELVRIFFQVDLAYQIIEMVPGAHIFFLFFMLILGFSICTALILAYVARYALIVLLTVMAPLAITAGAVPITRWLSWLWIKGIILALLLAPANAILLRLAGLATIGVFSGGMVGGLLNLFVAAGMLSALLMIDYAVIRGVFGAIGEIVSKAVSTTEAVIATAITGGGMILTAGLAGLGVGGATAAAGAGAAGATGGAGTAGAGAAGAGGTGSTGSAASASAASGRSAVSRGDSGSASPTGTGGSRSTSSSETGAEATRKALNDPGFLRRMSAALRTAGHSGMFSRSRVARALSGVARGAGDVMEQRARGIEWQQEQQARRLERQQEREEMKRERQEEWEAREAVRRQEREEWEQRRQQERLEARRGGLYRDWQRVLDTHGIVLGEQGFDEMARSLARLADEYGPKAVRRVAPEVIRGMAAARQYGGLSYTQQAQAAGLSSPGELLGSRVEERIRARGGDRNRPPLFKPGRTAKPGAWGSGPGLYDYQVGSDLAAALERKGGPETVNAYANLVWAVRNPGLEGGGPEAVSRLNQAVGEAWEEGSKDYPQFDYQAAWGAFANRVDALTTSLGLQPENLPAAWLQERNFLLAAGARRAQTAPPGQAAPPAGGSEGEQKA